MNIKTIVGIAAVLVCVPLLAVSCDINADNNPFKGTWESTEGYIAFFEDYTWHIPRYSGGVGLKGTYTFIDNTATVTYTEISNNDGTNWRPITSTESSAYTRTATVSGNTLTWGITTYRRR